MDSHAVRTYRELFSAPEFRALFAVSCLRYAGSATSGIALARLVYASTSSSLLSALSMFGPSIAQVIGAATLLSVADRIRPRAALTWIGVAYAALTVPLALPMPVWALLLVAVSTGLVGALNGGVQWGTMRELLPRDGYLLGRSAFTVANGVTQVVGFGVGGALVNIAGARPTLLFAAGAFALSAIGARLSIVDRSARLAGYPSVGATVRGNRKLLASSERRVLYAAMWVPNGLVVGCEAVFVPYSPRSSGLLLAATAIGMFAGDVVVARMLPVRVRGGLAPVLRLLLAVPYLSFVLHPPLALAVALAGVASAGYSAGLPLQERLLAITPDSLSGHGLGLMSSGMLSMQAAAAAMAGSIASLVSPATTITLMASASVAVTLWLWPRLLTGDRWIAHGPDTQHDQPAPPASS